MSQRYWNYDQKINFYTFEQEIEIKEIIPRQQYKS